MRAKIMGVVNVAPDSYYAPSRALGVQEACTRIYTMQEAGAEIIDIGGESTRPGADPVLIKEELSRVIPVLRSIRGKIGVQISIDTVKPEVAEAAIEEGVTLINDITGFCNPKMRTLAAEKGVDVCIMHMQGTPRTMQDNPSYDSVVEDIAGWLKKQAMLLEQEGVKKERIILDPGIGFGKTNEHIYAIIKNIRVFRSLGYRILVGLSRKSFLQRFFNKPASDLLAPTIALNTYLIQEGVDIIRVHDVREHVEALSIMSEVCAFC